ncbi:DUF2336 domain-containing protein [Microbacteriaceae bacterium K1510]|nr:DUF2336 domain-containing protein [Microbacteriaceae bacterium K1510]
MPQSPASPPLDGLLDLACRDGVDIRPTLLRVLTDLYVQKPAHTAYEETQYVELALGLIQSADEPTRAAVHASLRKYAAAPKAVLEALGEELAPPAPRPMAEAMQEIARAMAQEMARRTEAEPAPASASDDLVEVFFAATASERRLVLANLDVVGGPRLRPLAAAHETVAQLEMAALQRSPDAFCRTLMRDLGLDRRLAERIVRDDLGEGLVIVAKAIGMKAPVLQRILLFLNPAIGQSVDRVYDLANLFDEISTQAAAHLLSTWSKPVTRKPPVHAPVLYDDERRRARPASNNARGSERPAQPGAFKTNSR